MSFHLFFSFFLIFISFHPIYANTFVTFTDAGDDFTDVVYNLALYSPQLSTIYAKQLSIPIHSTTACNLTNFPIDDGHGNVWYQSNGETYADTVLLIDEKDCDIMQQASIAQQIGVIGLVIISPSESHVITTPIPASFQLTIPLLSISKIDGIRMQIFLNSSDTNHMYIEWEATSEPITTITPTGTIEAGTTEIPTTEIPTTTAPITTDAPTTTPTTQIPTTTAPITTDAPTTTPPPISSTGSSSSSTGISLSSTALPVNDASTCIPSIFILLVTFLCHVY